MKIQIKNHNFFPYLNLMGSSFSSSSFDPYPGGQYGEDLQDPEPPHSVKI